MADHLAMLPSHPRDATALSRTSLSEITERTTVLLRLEATTAYRPVDYLTSSPYFAEPQRGTRIEWRSKMCAWKWRLVDACGLSRHSVIRSMNYLDRFMASAHFQAREALADVRAYQLAAMVCLYVSVKTFERVALHADILAEISAGCYDAEEIHAMERVILEALEWRLNGPTSREFVCCLLGLLDAEWYGRDRDIPLSLLEFGAFQCELATGDYELSTACRPSEVALAAVLHGIQGVDEGSMSVTSRCRYLKRVCVAMGRRIDMERVRYAQGRLREVLVRNGGLNLSHELRRRRGSRRRAASRSSRSGDCAESGRNASLGVKTWSPSPVSVVGCPCPPARGRELFAKTA